jgi:hypothetical protein
MHRYLRFLDNGLNIWPWNSELPHDTPQGPSHIWSGLNLSPQLMSFMTLSLSPHLSPSAFSFPLCVTPTPLSPFLSPAPPRSGRHSPFCSLFFSGSCRTRSFPLSNFPLADERNTPTLTYPWLTLCPLSLTLDWRPTHPVLALWPVAFSMTLVSPISYKRVPCPPWLSPCSILFMRWDLDKTNLYKNRFYLGLLVDQFCKRGEGVAGNPISFLLLSVVVVPLTLLLVNSPTSVVLPFCVACVACWFDCDVGGLSALEIVWFWYVMSFAGKP